MTNRALVVGINYKGTSSALNGCIQDTVNILSYLKDRFQAVHEVRLVTEKEVSTDVSDQKDTTLYSIVQHMRKKFEHQASVDQVTHLTHDEYKKMSNLDMAKSSLEVLILTDDQVGAHCPTKANILKGFKWLIAGATADSHLFLSYSGHGSHQRDTNGDEEDGEDESLVPSDYKTAGMLVDDEIRRVLIDPLPEGANLRLIIDACHSATCSEQKFLYDVGYTGEMVRKTDYKAKETAANVVCWSGCFDAETSADAFINGTFNGALTYTLMEIMRDVQQDKSFESVYQKLREMLKKRRFDQHASLSSSSPLDLKAKFDLF